MSKRKTRKVVREWQLMLNGKRVVVSAGPPPTKADLELRQEHERSFQEYLASDAYRRYCEAKKAREAEHAARVARRPADMGRNYRLPGDIAVFLERLYVDHDCGIDLPGNELEQQIIRIAMRGAYLQGCRQGFIEGFLYGEEKARPGALKNRERLRQQNIKKLERLGIKDRNAAIVTEFHRLEREMPGVEERKEHLAEQHQVTPRQIANILKAARQRRP